MRIAFLRRLGEVVLAALITAAIGVLSTPRAGGDDKVPLGGGAGIVVAGSYCTLTTIGHDNTGELVGFTAAHCGGPGAQVVAEGSAIAVGTVATTDEGLDYAVIKFDVAKVSPVAVFDGFAIDGIGPDPGFLQPACTQGGATGVGCGQITVAGVRPATMTANMSAWQPGDDGAPVTVEGDLVGMTRHGHTKVLLPVPTVITHIELTLFSAILDDANTKGVPGAGFTPIRS